MNNISGVYWQQTANSQLDQTQAHVLEYVSHIMHMCKNMYHMLDLDEQ